MNSRANDLYDEMMVTLRGYPEDDRRHFFLMMLATCAGALRASDGNKFVEGYLLAAMEDNNFGIFPQIDS